MRGWVDPDGSLPPEGQLLFDDDGSRVQYHLCGRWWAKLGMHVRKGHGMDPDDYREAFGLNRSTGLVAPALAKRIAEKISPAFAAHRRFGCADVPAEALERRRGRSRRTEAKLQQRTRVRARLASSPQLRAATAAPLTAPAVIERTQRRLVELRSDPAWAEAWRRRVSAGKRTLTPEQLRAITAERGRATAQDLAERYGVSRSIVWRIWRGDSRVARRAATL